jgi:hypothetical protein
MGMGRYGFFMDFLYRPPFGTPWSFGRGPKDRLADIKMDGAIENASTTSDTSHLIKVFWEIVKLMH